MFKLIRNVEAFVLDKSLEHKIQIFPFFYQEANRKRSISDNRTKSVAEANDSVRLYLERAL